MTLALLLQIALVLSLLLWTTSTSAHIDAKSSNIQSTSIITTCEAITINYITHSLPQSCLTSAWAGPEQSSTDSLLNSHPSASPTDVESASPSSESATHTVSIETAHVSQEVGGDGTKPFMSFEDWKEKMLRETGQDPKDIRPRSSSQRRPDDRMPPDMGHAGLGEEDEISLNFDSYLDNNKPGEQRDRTAGSQLAGSSDHGVTDPVTYDEGRPSIHRSKDAGKTCKERFSYSSFDGGATVLKWSPGAKNYKAILVENKDSYMLLECSARQKFVIVELSDDILIDTIVLANFEFFSSMIRHFRLSVSDHYPVKADRWRDLGTFEARNSRDIQPFLVENPQIWAKYVRIEFLTHYGNEYYCPVSLLRVHGSRLLDSWKDGEAVRDEESNMDDELEQAHGEIQSDGQNMEIGDRNLESDSNPESSFVEEALSCPVIEPSQLFSPVGSTCLASFDQVIGQTSPHNNANTGELGRSSGQGVSRDPVEGRATSNLPTSRTGPSPMEETSLMPPTITSSAPLPSMELANSSLDPTSTITDLATDSTMQVMSIKPSPNSEASAPVVPVGKVSPQGAPSGKNRTNGVTGSPTTSPPVQDGFFKAITKRLQQVESNLTLSLKYVEDQARHLQESLQRTEQKQISKANLFLDHLNRTVLAEMRNVRDQYDQIWQSTVIALESQREQSQREIVALSTRLNVLADEVVFQKRMAIVQAVLLLSCLVLVIFSRGVSLPYLAPFTEQANGSPFEATTSSRAYARARGLYGHVYETIRDEPATYNMQTEVDFMSGKSTTEDVGLLSSPRLRVERPAEDEADLLQCQRLSPPPTPTLADDLSMPDMPLQSRESQPPVLHHSPSKQQGNLRKPLPALPENPSSP